MTCPAARHEEMRTAVALSILTAAMAAVQSAGGILVPGIYRDNLWVVGTWHGTDLVTLMIAVPILLVGIYYARQGSCRGWLLWIGMLYYVLYNNMYYLFGTAFNRFIIVYELLLVLSAGALLSALVAIDAGRIAAHLRPGGWTKWIAGWMFVLAAILLANALSEYIAFLRDGQVPQIIADTGLQTDLVAICDMTLWVPLLLLGGVWLLRSRPWGYIVSPLILVSAGVYFIGLVAATWFQDIAGIPGAMTFMPLWIALAAGSLVSSAAFLAALKSPEHAS
ncbi:MAG: hypothetical protein LUQ25_05950 [Methanoregulaceae archaeon]|nr:hypothetical protein [Methanoregulaceae archaeon]